MDSTNIYHRIYKSTKHNESLFTQIELLNRTINKDNNFQLMKGMNKQQLLAQIYLNLKQPINELNHNLSKIINKNNHSSTIQKINNHIVSEQQQYSMVNNENNMNQIMIEQESQDNKQQIKDNQEQQQRDSQELFENQQDVGIYGQQLDEQSLPSYEDKMYQPNEYSQNKEQNNDDENEEIMENNWDHFRSVQKLDKQELKKNNTKSNISKINEQIQLLQNKALKSKHWTLQGQIKAKDRPQNSLLQHNLQFSSGLKTNHNITPEYNQQIEQVIKQRVLNQLYDDRVRFNKTVGLREHFGSERQVSTEKDKKGLAELYELQFKNYLGLGENKNDKLKRDILQNYKMLSYKLDSLSNFNFIPQQPFDSKKASNPNKQALIIEQKVPITLSQGNQQPQRQKISLQSQKQVDKKHKRLKNKRIARQRKKQQAQKRMNRKIQYGGMTKFELKAQNKAISNAQKSISRTKKYNQSKDFFTTLSQKKDKPINKKPNYANINKLKL